jgi:hypothetical protein
MSKTKIRLYQSVWDGIIRRMPKPLPPSLTRADLLRAVIGGGIKLGKMSKKESETIQLGYKEDRGKPDNFVRMTVPDWVVSLIQQRVVKDNEVLSTFGQEWKQEIELKLKKPVPISHLLRWLSFGLFMVQIDECHECEMKEIDLLVVREENQKLCTENEELMRQKEELRVERDELLEALSEIREEFEKYKNVYEIMEKKVEEVKMELESEKKERERLRKLVSEHRKDEELLDQLGECNTRVSKLKEMEVFLSILPVKNRKTIDNLTDPKQKRKRMDVLRCAASLMGDSMEDITRCLSVLYKIESSPPRTEIKSVLERLTTEETWEVCMKCDLSDSQLETLRKVLKEKRSSLGKLFGCSRAVGDLRRKKTTEIEKCLNIERTPNDVGVYCQVSASIQKILEFYPAKGAWMFRPTQKFKYKLSGDGKVDAGQTQWMFGISPLSIPSICVQSPYNVFPLALVLCDEKSDVLKEQLKNLFTECKELNEKGVLVRKDGRKHLLEFIFVSDLKTCWQVFEFGGHTTHSNCPFCNVVTPKDRADHHKKWETWSRKPHLVSFLGIPIEQFVFCTLHMVMRCIEFFLQDVYNKVAKTKEETELAFIMVREIGVGWSVYEGGKKNKGKRVRSYSGSQYRKILGKIEKIAKLIKVENEKEKDLGDIVWGGFRKRLAIVEDGHVYEKCKKRKYLTEEKQRVCTCLRCFDKEGRKWTKNFCALHGADKLRIYFHLLMCHSGALVVKFGAFRPLSQQGFERANCEHNYYARRHSGHQYGTRKRKRDGTYMNDAVLQVLFFLFFLLFFSSHFYSLGCY